VKTTNDPLNHYVAW